MEGKRVAVVGVLAIQGAFAEHKHCLTQGFQQLQKSEKLNCELEVCEVRTRNDLAGLHGLVIPGGESTTMSKFLDRGHFIDVIQEWRKGKAHISLFYLGFNISKLGQAPSKLMHIMHSSRTIRHFVKFVP